MSNAQKRASDRYRSNLDTKDRRLAAEAAPKRRTCALKKLLKAATPSPLAQAMACNLAPEEHNGLETMGEQELVCPAVEHDNGSLLVMHEFGLENPAAAEEYSAGRRLQEQNPEDQDTYSEGGLFCVLLRVRSRYHSWTNIDERGWGPETRWTEAFNDDLEQVETVGPKKREQLFRSLDLHCTQGREMLQELKWVGNMSRAVRCDPELVKDTFLQVFDLIILILSEVKFVEVKIDEHLLYT